MLKTVRIVIEFNETLNYGKIQKDEGANVNIVNVYSLFRAIFSKVKSATPIIWSIL